MAQTHRRLSVDDLLARQEIAELLHDYARGIDFLDFVLFRSLFSETIRLDLSAWNGQPAADIRIEYWIEGLRQRMAGFDATEHIIVNSVVERKGDSAICRPYMVALHHLVVDGIDQMHALGGEYENRVIRDNAGWKINAVKVLPRWEMGDRQLFTRAFDRPDKRPCLG